MHEILCKKKKASVRISSLIARIILIFCSMAVVFPILWTILTSLKTNTEVLASPWSLPAMLQFDNYARAFEKAQISDYLLNSIFVVTLSMILMLLLVVPGAYSISRLKFRITNIVKTIYIGCLFLQINVLLVPIYLMMTRFRMTDNLVWLSVVLVATSIPFNTFMLTGFMKGINTEYEYAAMIDGCSYVKILTSIIVPLSAPAISTICVLTFFSFFNEYILTLTLISTDSLRTLPIGLSNLFEVERYATDWGALMAGLIIMLIPTIIVYLFGQKKLMQGMNVGGMKG